jgi:hypothetical protein
MIDSKMEFETICKHFIDTDNEIIKVKNWQIYIKIIIAEKKNDKKENIEISERKNDNEENKKIDEIKHYEE